MIRASVTITIAADRRSDVLWTLRSFVGPVRAESGCLECSVYEDAEDASRFCLVEEWATEEQLRRRLRSKGYLNLLALMELSTVAPAVRFDFCDDRRGMELIHNVRGG